MTELNNRFELINSRRQPKNLKRILTRAKFVTEEIECGTSKCGNKRCGTCPLILETNTFNFNAIDSPFTIKGKLNCTAKNVIYVIQCSGCHYQYIGQTNDLRKRVTLHKQHIRDSNLGKLKVSRHIDACAVGKEPPFRICPLITKQNQKERELLENYFIQKYSPELNEAGAPGTTTGGVT